MKWTITIAAATAMALSLAACDPKADPAQEPDPDPAGPAIDAVMVDVTDVTGAIEEVPAPAGADPSLIAKILIVTWPDGSRTLYDDVSKKHFLRHCRTEGTNTWVLC